MYLRQFCTCSTWRTTHQPALVRRIPSAAKHLLCAVTAASNTSKPNTSALMTPNKPMLRAYIKCGKYKSTLLHLSHVSFIQSFVCPTGTNPAASCHPFPCFDHKSNALATRSAYLFTSLPLLVQDVLVSLESNRCVSPALLGRGLHRKRAEGRLAGSSACA